MTLIRHRVRVGAKTWVRDDDIDPLGVGAADVGYFRSTRTLMLA